MLDIIQEGRKCTLTNIHIIVNALNYIGLKDDSKSIQSHLVIFTFRNENS